MSCSQPSPPASFASPGASIGLPPELVAALDLSKAQQVPGSWVDDALRDHHSDVAHSIPLRSTEAADGQTESVLLYQLWEHQSSVPPMMALRPHRNTTRLLEDWSREHSDERQLPPVIALVLHQGEKEWTAPKELE
ncbi:MAG: Rpn family recombination-promoting nuclease/putative transposase, partial [Myxococcota bacterium]|nr:Rpn family recombination-promoting nuclease/putative transposase [Myxococcota bacterium]